MFFSCNTVKHIAHLKCYPNFINHFYIILKETLKKLIIILNFASALKTGCHTQQSMKKHNVHLIFLGKVEKSCHVEVPMMEFYGIWWAEICWSSYACL